MVLRSDADDAPRQLARLGAAHRTLSDRERRAAHDLARGVELRPLGEDLLEELLTRAVADAAPEEVMPERAGPAGWTRARREGFLAFHRARMEQHAGPGGEQIFAVMADGRPVGVGRVAPLDEHGTWEIVVWIGRSARGRGIGAASVRALGERVRDAGGTGAVSRRRDDDAGVD